MGITIAVLDNQVPGPPFSATKVIVRQMQFQVPQSRMGNMGCENSLVITLAGIDQMSALIPLDIVKKGNYQVSYSMKKRKGKLYPDLYVTVSPRLKRIGGWGGTMQDALDKLRQGGMK